MNNCAQKILFLYGPTASGKTDFADMIAQALPVEIINMDVAQCYTPLSIGTAKPDWKASAYEQHLFDCIDTPTHLTVTAYRAWVLELCQKIWLRKKIPLFVGGSGFYLKSILFPPLMEQAVTIVDDKMSEALHKQDLWQKLHEIDPDRAEQIHPNDIYRIKRALDIWQMTGEKPSLYKPSYQPPASYLLIHVTRAREELYQRINQRVLAMFKAGWLDEAKPLMGTPWESFLNNGFIGYQEVFAYMREQCTLQEAIAIIQQRTRNYAKRQETFWRLLKKEVIAATDLIGEPEGKILEFDLTYPDVHLYIKQLLYEFSSLGCGEYEPS